MKFVFWWNSPCKGIIGVLRDFCINFSPESIVITAETSIHRKNMGWEEIGELFPQHIISHRNSQWEENTNKYFDLYSDGYIHVFNGIDRPIFYHLVKKAYTSNIRYCFMTEAYSNLEFGMKRVLKSLYLNLYLPVRLHNITKSAELVFCLSGKKQRDINQLRKIGFSRQKIVPFGYWTDVDTTFDKSNTEKLQILCPGVLQQYKGVDILLKAVKILKDKGITDFLCHITGKGEIENKLKAMSQSFGTGQNVVFHGVLEQKKYDELAAKIDVLVAPGYIEPWGIRVNESIQREQPVICSDGLGASDLVAESKCGMVFHSGNYKELARCMEIYIKDRKRLDMDKILCHSYKREISCYKKAEILYGELKKIL
jgi:glycosyltransferase involved in cell wall biosynthesis